MKKKESIFILPFLKERHCPLCECHCGHPLCKEKYIQTRVDQHECVYGMKLDGTLDQHPLLVELIVMQTKSTP